MTATEPQSTGPQSTARLFAGLVPDEVSAAYQKLLDAGGVPKREAPEFVGGTEIMKSLSKLGMAHVNPHTPASPATFQPAPPDLALEGVLTDLQFRLLRGHELLLDGHRRLSLVQAEHPEMAKLPEHMVHVTTDRQQILQLTRYLINTVHQDWMTLESISTDMPLTEDYAIDGPPAIREQACIRSIYDRAFTGHPLGVKMIRTCVAAGEQARVLPRIPMKMQLADTTAVLLPLTPTGTGGALLIRARPIVTAMRDYFELLWEKATPFGSTRAQQVSGVTPAERAILELLNQGMQDAAIARQTGMSQSTVRRHITAMTSRLKVNSRFAFGAAAQRRGWLD